MFPRTGGYSDINQEVSFHVETIEQIKKIMAEMEEGDEEFLEWKQVLAQEESDFERKEKSRWEYSSEVIGQYRKLAPYILFDHGDLIWEISDGLNIEGTLLKYFEGQATLDQVLLELDNKVAMLYLEMK